MSDTQTITFEAGYRRLQAIAEEVNGTEVPVDRLADLFAEGKALERSLTDHLAEQRARIERMRGEEAQSVRIVPASERRETEHGGGDHGEELGRSGQVSSPSPTSDDDIPF